MDFAALPPEINSARMYSGPGSAPMLAAATAWQTAAADLYAAAASYSAVTSGLTGFGWRGPSSLSMAAAAATYVTWLGATATQAEQAANQAQAAASAFEAAFAATVPPPVIAANRIQLATLVATNFLGMNTPAIMATEAQYAEMWAQDAAAMYGYAGSSAAATTALTPFTPPKRNTNPAGLASQSAAVTKSTASSTGPSIDTIIQQILDNINNALAPDHINSGISAFATIPSIILSAASLANSGSTTAADTVTALSDVSAGLSRVATTLGSVGSASSALTGGPVTAIAGRASTVGALSVPQSWGAAAPAMANSAKALPVTLVSETQDLGDMPSPVSLAAPGTVAAGAAARGRPTAADGATLRALMRPNMLPRKQYIG